MKAKLHDSIKILLLLLAGVLVTAAVFHLVDAGFNGLFGNWFKNRYISYQTFPSGGGNYYTEETLDWFAIKSDLLLFLTVGTIFWLSLILTVVSFVKKRTENQASDDISEMIRQYISHDTEATLIFPDKYAKVSAEMAEIKAFIAKREQLLKDEAAKKNDLITYLAHDLKTPLTSVIGYLSLLDELPDMPLEQKAKYVRISLDKALRLEKLVNEFFEITRYNLQQIYLEKETLSLSYMLVQIADEFYPILKEHGNTIEIQSEEDLTIYADPEKLARVFNNILKNAIAYSYPNTPITVSASRSSNAVCIAFQNKGRTIPSQKLDSIFEKFFRLDDSRSSNTGGAGLGLAIAREIVALHGGSITAHSQSEHTTFTVSLPLSY